MTHVRRRFSGVLPLALVCALAACDTAAPDSGAPLTFSVASATASEATIVLDGHSLGTVPLPWSATRASGAYTLSASAETPLNVTVRSGTQTVKRSQGSHVHVSHSDSDHDEVEVEGSIESLTETSIAVAGQTFVVDSATQFDGFETLEALAVGDRVEVEGDEQTGTLTARTIEIEDDSDDESDDRDDDDIEVEGRIESLSETSISVAGLTFEVDTATRFDGFGTLSDLVPGDRVEVEGYDETGLLVASEIERDDDDDSDDHDSDDDESDN